MTTPGGVPNLPAGALTLDTLAASTQDMSGPAMKARAVGRFPSIMDLSTGLSPALAITPFGILTSIWAEVNSLIANADPADVQGPEDLPELVLEFIEGLPFVGQFIELLQAILGEYTGDDTTLLTVQEIFAPIRAIVEGFGSFAGIDLLDPASITTALEGFLGPNSPLNAFNIFGLLGGANIPFLPFSHVGAGEPNLLVESSFTDSDSLGPGGVGWAWDGTVGHTDLGSAKATPAGVARELVSIPIEVGEGQSLALSTWISWAGAVYTGTNHVTLGLRTYLGDTYLGTTALANQTFTVGTQATWQQLTGTYTVPAGVDSIRLRFAVGGNVTAGNVWFDDANTSKTGTMQQDWIGGLVEQFTGILDLFGLSALTDLIGVNVTDIWSNIIENIFNPLGLFTEVGVPIIQSLMDTIFDVFDSGTPNHTSGNPLSSVFDSLFGIFNVAGQSQAQNVIQDVRITNLMSSVGPTGTIIEENFDGAAAAPLSSTDWNLTHVVTSGGGGPLLDGAGTLYWQKDGSGAVSSYRMRYKSKTLDTDTHLVQLVLMSDVPMASLTVPYVSIIDRIDATEANFIEYRIDQSQVSIYKWVSGTATILGTAVSYATPKAGTWSIKSGTDTPTTGNREFVMLHNGSEIIRRTDTGATSLVGAGNRQVGIYYYCGNEFAFFFGIQQAGPPNLGSFGAVDRDPAA